VGHVERLDDVVPERQPLLVIFFQHAHRQDCLDSSSQTVEEKSQNRPPVGLVGNDVKHDPRQLVVRPPQVLSFRCCQPGIEHGHRDRVDVHDRKRTMLRTLRQLSSGGATSQTLGEAGRSGSVTQKS
jgi:hypothetical protein